MFIYVLVFELAGEGLSPTKLPRLVWCIDVCIHLPMTKYTAIDHYLHCWTLNQTPDSRLWARLQTLDSESDSRLWIRLQTPDSEPDSRLWIRLQTLNQTPDSRLWIRLQTLIQTPDSRLLIRLWIRVQSPQTGAQRQSLMSQEAEVLSIFPTYFSLSAAL